MPVPVKLDHLQILLPFILGSPISYYTYFEEGRMTARRGRKEEERVVTESIAYILVISVAQFRNLNMDILSSLIALFRKGGRKQDISINLGRTDSPEFWRTIYEGSHFFKMLGVPLFRAL